MENALILYYHTVCEANICLPKVLQTPVIIMSMSNMGLLFYIVHPEH